MSKFIYFIIVVNLCQRLCRIKHTKKRAVKPAFLIKNCVQRFFKRRRLNNARSFLLHIKFAFRHYKFCKAKVCGIAYAPFRTGNAADFAGKPHFTNCLHAVRHLFVAVALYYLCRCVKVCGRLSYFHAADNV